MRKQFLVLETTQFEVPPPAPVAPRREREIRQNVELRMGGEGGVAVRPQPVAREGHFNPDPERYIFWEETKFVMCYSMHDAEEYVNIILERNPQFKFIILESVAFLETIASPTVRKMWDANGQLVNS